MPANRHDCLVDVARAANCWPVEFELCSEFLTICRRMIPCGIRGAYVTPQDHLKEVFEAWRRACGQPLRIPEDVVVAAAIRADIPRSRGWVGNRPSISLAIHLMGLLGAVSRWAGGFGFPGYNGPRGAALDKALGVDTSARLASAATARREAELLASMYGPPISPPADLRTIDEIHGALRRQVMTQGGTWMRDVVKHFGVKRLSDLSRDDARDALAAAATRCLISSP